MCRIAPSDSKCMQLRYGMLSVRAINAIIGSTSPLVAKVHWKWHWAKSTIHFSSSEKKPTQSPKHISCTKYIGSQRNACLHLNYHFEINFEECKSKQIHNWNCWNNIQLPLYMLITSGQQVMEENCRVSDLLVWRTDTIWLTTRCSRYSLTSIVMPEFMTIMLGMTVYVNRKWQASLPVP